MISPSSYPQTLSEPASTQMVEPFVCLMYHNVMDQHDINQYPGVNRSIMRYFTWLDKFDFQMSMIQKHARCLGLTELLLGVKLDGHANAHLKHVHLTFDDGWAGTFDRALPVLQKYDLEATLFVTTNLLGKPGFMQPHQLKNLPPHLKIGSHAHTHTMLDELSYQEVEAELRLSKQILEDLTGSAVNTFAFPGGSFVSDHIKIAHEVGYELVFNSMVGINRKFDPSFIKRIPIYEWTLHPTFRRYLNHQVLPEYIRQQALSIPKKLLKKQQYLKIRELFLGEKHD